VRLAWLADRFELVGGAELTAAEFRAAAPRSVTVVECGPGELEAVAGCDAVCLHNTATYPPELREAVAGKPALRYWHDMAWGDPSPVTGSVNVFTSPLHRDRFPHAVDGDVHLVPPPVRLGEAAKRKRPRGACWLGSGQHAGKGVLQACEWAERHEPVDFWGPLTLEETPRVRVKGVVPHEHVPTILRLYARFVFLPTHPEPFGRAVVEAWAVGCELIVNRNVGALHWLERPEKIESAGEDFWRLVEAL
jgi:hypothetical protein